MQGRESDGERVPIIHDSSPVAADVEATDRQGRSRVK